MKFDNKSAKLLRDAINTALEDVGTKFGVKIDAGNCSYNPSAGTGHYKLEFVSLAENGQERDLDAEAFTTYAPLIGLDPADLGKPVMVGGRPFTIAGYRPKARKNQIVIKDINGTIYTTSVEVVSRNLKLAIR